MEGALPSFNQGRVPVMIQFEWRNVLSPSAAGPVQQHSLHGRLFVTSFLRYYSRRQTDFLAVRILLLCIDLARTDGAGEILCRFPGARVA